VARPVYSEQFFGAEWVGGTSGIYTISLGTKAIIREIVMTTTATSPGIDTSGAFWKLLLDAELAWQWELPSPSSGTYSWQGRITGPPGPSVLTVETAGLYQLYDFVVSGYVLTLP
jgi:hypothetical protein